ncbi:uncharacterized protein BcabD6B2_18260 [Babesia caballi]|uniref:Uncharacterized protein n=1 Tax=Babesia caballi TaxID=5871 RepID=A0AAV4LRD5_BABCB|nr:hypothetical protein, conserved [Babesia caballi]
MTPPVYIGECLVVEGKAGKEDFGVGSVKCDRLFRRLIIRRRRFDIVNLSPKLGGIVDPTVVGNQLLKLSGHIHLTGIPSFEDFIKVRPDFLVDVIFSRILKLIFKTLHRVNNIIKRCHICPLPLNFPKLINFPIDILQPLRSLPVTPGQLTNNTINILLVYTVTLNRPIFTKTLQHPYRKRYSRIAQPMRRNVGRSDARAGDSRSVIIIKHSTIIPDELLKSVGQTFNETILVSTQSLNNLPDLLTMRCCGTLNRLKKLLNLLG